MKQLLITICSVLLILVVFTFYELRQRSHDGPCDRARTQDQYLACMVKNSPPTCDETCMMRRHFQ